MLQVVFGVTSLIIITQGANVTQISDLEQAFRKSHIIPKQLTKSPNETLWIRYKSDLPIKTGQTYSTESIKGVPRVLWHCDRPPVYYTLVCIGLNEWQLYDKKPTSTPAPIPSPDLIKWLVVNIPQNDYREGAVIHPYKHPTPVLGYDKLLYLFLVYKQDKGINAYDYRFLENTNMKQFGPDKKQDFPHLRELEKFYQIYNIVAANFFWYRFTKDEISDFLDPYYSSY
ncbi:putative odorant-binding protein A5 [Planococcus citri]|uniref:putative odorant-binding protein A5 n=1 Tax=Planococcus citri TaxID=170843 RepID=UPI0031F8C05F